MTDLQARGPAHVLYVELRAPDASERLRPVLHALAGRPGFRGAELLHSPAQPGLALVQARFGTEPPEVPLPAGARSWTFVVDESVQP